MSSNWLSILKYPPTQIPVSPASICFYHICFLKDETLTIQSCKRRKTQFPNFCQLGCQLLKLWLNGTHPANWLEFDAVFVVAFSPVSLIKIKSSSYITTLRNRKGNQVCSQEFFFLTPLSDNHYYLDKGEIFPLLTTLYL